MKKIYKLKEWYSLDDAAERLTLTLSEEIRAKDVLQLAVEGHIKLSWYMRHVTAQEVAYGEKIIPPIPEIFPGRNYSITAVGFYAVHKDGNVEILDGPHRILLEECGALSDYLLAQITNTGGELLSLDGYYVQDNNGKIWNILERFDDQFIKDSDSGKKRKFYDSSNYFPSGEWPEISELGFTRNDIEMFENALMEKDKHEVSTRERQTLYKMIIGMAKDAYGYDPEASRSPFPKELEGILDNLDIPVSDDTIRDKLKEASEFLPQNIDE